MYRVISQIPNKFHFVDRIITLLATLRNFLAVRHASLVHVEQARHVPIMLSMLPTEHRDKLGR